MTNNLYVTVVSCYISYYSHLMTLAEQKAIDTRRAIGISVIEEDAWKYARQDASLQNALRSFPKRTFNILQNDITRTTTYTNPNSNDSN